MKNITPQEKSILAKQIAEVALLHGNFTLRSGRTSNYYLDKYLFSTIPEILAPLGQMFANLIDTKTTDRLAGAELGGIPLVTAASLATNLPAIFVRNKKKDYGTSKQIEGKINKNDRIILLEDIATTGGQILEAAKTLEQLGAKIVKVIAVIDRSEGARDNIEKAGYNFKSLFTKQDLGVEE